MHEVGVPVSGIITPLVGLTQNARLSDSDTEDPRRGAAVGVGMAGPDLWDLLRMNKWLNNWYVR